MSVLEGDYMFSWNKNIDYWQYVINIAIENKKKIRFFYNALGTDFKLHLKRQEPYIVSPYKVVVNNEKLYVIGHMDQYDDVIYFRLDKMTEVECLDENSNEISDNTALVKA